MQQNLQIQNLPTELQTSARKDLEKRSQPTDLRADFENIMSSSTTEDIKSKNVQIIGNTILTPDVLTKAKNAVFSAS